MADLYTRNKAIVLGMSLLLPVFIGRIQELIPALSGWHLSKIAIAFACLLLFLTPSGKRQGLSTLLSAPQGKYALSIIVLGFISVPFSIWVGGSFGFIIDFLKNTLFIFLLISCVESEEDIRIIVWMLILTALMLVSYSFVNPKTVETGRVYVTGTYDPNDFALFLVMVLPLAFFLMEQETGLKKLFLITVLMLMIFTTLKTGSRGGLLSLLTVILCVLYSKGLSYTLKISPLLLGLLLVLSIYVSDTFWERFATILEPNADYNTTASVGRVEVWKRGLELMVENPVLGTGVGTFSMAEGTKHEGGKWSAAHNSLIQIGSELGFTGLFLYVMMIYHSITFVLRNDAGMPWLQKGLVFGLYGFCVGGMFLSWAYWPALYFFIGLTILYGKLSQQHLQISQQADSPSGC